jgi:membrane protein implicated in regulation of membrane protease activity
VRKLHFNVIVVVFGLFALMMGVSGLLGLLAGTLKGVAQSIFAGLIVAGLYYFLKGSIRGDALAPKLKRRRGCRKISLIEC